MKKRRMIALILAGALLAGQTAYAQEMTPAIESVDAESEELYDEAKDITDLLTDTDAVNAGDEENTSENNTISEDSVTGENAASETVERTEKEFAAESAQDSSLDDEVIIKDENLRDYLMEHFNVYDEESDSWVTLGADGYISKSEMKSITSIVVGIFDAGTIKISDFGGLEYAENLQQLSFSENVDLSGLTDISPLKRLTKLEWLDLNGANIVDISDIENLTNISNLSLNDTKVTDISALKNFNQLEWLELNNTPVSDLSPLTDLPLLYTIRLNGCSKVTTLHPLDTLFEKHQILNLDISGTSISEEERLDILCGMYIPSELVVGDGDINLNYYTNHIFDPGFQFSAGLAAGSSGCISVADNVISVKGVGSATLRLALNGTVKEYTVEVRGVSDDDMIPGEAIDYTVDYISEKDGWNTSKLLTSNGELWDLYPEASCIKRNVKDYVSEWVYSGSDAAHVEYALDYDNVLWSGETKIAENIQKYDGHYALTADHMLIDIYNDQGTRLEGVSDWVQDTYSEYDEAGETYKRITTYVLKQDGTLWSREEVEKSAAVNPFQKVTDGVKQLFEGYYLADDGKYYNFSGEETSYSQKFDDEGNFCLGGKIIGKFNIKEYFDHYYYVYFLTEEGGFYHWYFTGGSGGGSGIWTGGQILSGVESVSRDVDGNYICKLTDGTCYSVTGTIGSEITEIDYYQLDWLYDYDGVVEASYALFLDPATGEQWIERNGIILLDHILTAWEADFYQGNGNILSIVYAVRTDGTVWTMENRLPVKIADLDDPGIETGNLNGDGDVNVVDLMMCLHYVSGREPLEGNALLAADINGDGVVNVVDLMRMLHFISGRSSTL